MPPKRNMVNAEGEAQPQFRDQDFIFDDAKKRTMMGSDGQIINLDEVKAEPPRVFKSKIAGTSTREQKWMMNMMSSEYTVYTFTISFGTREWDVGKRYSDFDKLDNRLNDKFGLPPVGLPPKKWFGLTEPELIDMRHKMLNAYISDCIKRPVLIHSKEMQRFIEMPDDVIEAVSRGS